MHLFLEQCVRPFRQSGHSHCCLDWCSPIWNDFPTFDDADSYVLGHLESALLRPFTLCSLSLPVIGWNTKKRERNARWNFGCAPRNSICKILYTHKICIQWKLKFAAQQIPEDVVCWLLVFLVLGVSLCSLFRFGLIHLEPWSLYGS